MNRCDLCVHFRAETAVKVPVCGKHGFPLAKSTTPDDKRPGLYGAIADACPDFSTTETPVAFPTARPVVGYPKPNLLQVAGEKASTRVPPSSCTKCAYYIPPRVTLREWGFEVGACALKAELIPSSQAARMAQGCDLGHVGPNRQWADDVILDQRYDDDFIVRAQTAHLGRYKGFDPMASNAIDPREYPSDLPVTDDEAEVGIRAWQLVHDPKGNRPPIPLPIFDHESEYLGLSRDPRDTYGDHKPDLYVDHAGLLYTMVFSMMGGMKDGYPGVNYPLALVGEAGGGKTEGACFLAYRMNLPFHRISMRPDMESYEFFGSPILEKDEEGGEVVTGFRLGRFSKVYGEPGVICLDEPNMAPDAIWALLRPALDSAAQLVIESEDLVIDRHPFCFPIMAMNPPKAGYRGTRPLGDADRDRILKRWLDLPDEETEKSIIRKHCESVGYILPENILDKLMRIGAELRQMHKAHAIASPWGIRKAVMVAKMTWGFELEDAFRLGVLDDMDEAEAEVILNIIRSYA